MTAKQAAAMEPAIVKDAENAAEIELADNAEYKQANEE
jgi:hypothetical protein